MKKQLLSIFAALTVSAVMAQVPSPSLNINQDAVYPNPASVTNPGVKFLDAVDANVVWTVGYDAAAPRRNYNWYSRSTNGGATFAGGNIFPDTNTYVIANLEGIDANTAWVSSFMKGSQDMGAIHRTTNGGATWVNMTAAGMYTNSTSFTDIVSFFTPSIGITMGDPVNNEFEIWRTTDGGLSWNQLPGSSIADPLSSGEYAIVNLYYKLGTSNLWFGTNQGRMYRTVDAGLTWSASVVGAPSSTLTEIAFSSPLNGICTLVNNNAIELWSTTNGGATWSQITPIDPNFGFNDIGGVPGTGVLVSVDNANQMVSSSIDNGVTWTDWLSTGIGYVTLDFASPTAGWVGTYDIPSFGNMWKYSGAAITGTTSPTSAFGIPANLCLSGPAATISPVNTSTGSPYPTFSWSGAPAGVLFSSPTASAPLITFTAGGTYTITLVANSSAGSNSSSQVITVAACVAPTSNFSLPASACSNFSFAATNTSTGSPAPSYFWSVSPAANVTITPSAIAMTPNFKMANVGTYSITLVTANASGTASSTQTIAVAPCPPNASVALSYSCDASNTFSTISSSSNPPGTSGSITYTWSVSPSAGVSILPNPFTTNVRVVLGASATGEYTLTTRVRNPSGTTTVTTIVPFEQYSCTVGLKESNFLAANLSVYPNPAHDVINVSLPSTVESYKVKLTNLLGSVVFEESVTKNNKESVSVNVANKAKGVYFLTVEANNQKVTKKIVVE